LRWSSESQKLKKLILKIWFYKRETQKKRENRRRREQERGRERETVTVAGTGAGTGNVFDPSNAGYPPLVIHISQLAKLFIALVTIDKFMHL
jgi:hypothetical protein